MKIEAMSKLSSLSNSSMLSNPEVGSWQKLTNHNLFKPVLTKLQKMDFTSECGKDKIFNAQSDSLEKQRLLLKINKQDDDAGDTGNDAGNTGNARAWHFYWEQNDDGDTQLHIAVIENRLEDALNLIYLAPHPCLLDIQNDDGHTALHLAVHKKQSLIVRHLVLAGANFRCKTQQGNTPLHLACKFGNIMCAKALTNPISPINFCQNCPNKRWKRITLPQNLEERNYNGENCLHIAVLNGHKEIVRLLLDRGADLEAREGLRGMTALHLAISHKIKPMIKYLLNECQPSFQTKNYERMTAYQLALYYRYYKLAKILQIQEAKPEPLPEIKSDSETKDFQQGET